MIVLYMKSLLNLFSIEAKDNGESPSDLDSPPCGCDDEDGPDVHPGLWNTVPDGWASINT